MFVNMSVERASASGELIMTQSYSRSAYCAHCPKTFSFELYGEKIDPNLSQSQSREKEKVEDHYLCSNRYTIIPCNINGRVYSFELSGEKIDPNIDLRNKKKKEDDNGINGNTLRRSISMEILDACNNEPDFMDDGDLPDGVHNGSSHYIHDKKKGSIWTTDEHKLFLLGLDKLGKGDWRGISKKYVQTRTPTQVASHAQKYFIRMKAREKGKRRSSLFDMPNEPMRYGNNRIEHKSSNPECSTMVPFGPIMSGFYPFGSNRTQRISQTPFMTHESSRAGASTSTSKYDVV